ncbi:hypothetical protein [Curtobacterium sp. CFBP9011]|uniref:hypothetical protein n=2 Tax=Curtobacterium TaxID=2034 RepID=UPI002A6AD2B1|nr:hypothetical protein [Curtobacterium sp. CFBP9011]MDY1003897.1 hypothetical protein [Curtobacterium sp. CFBP9011]
MRGTPLFLRRARARVALLASVAAVVAASTAVPLLAVGLGDAGARSGAAAVLAERPARAAAAVVSAPLDDRPDRQRQRVTAAITDRLPSRAGSVRWAASATVALGGDGAAREVRIASVPDLASIAHVVSGSWPGADADTGPAAAAVQADAATRLGLRVGDVVAVGPAGVAQLRVAATWRADDPLAAVWAGASDVGSGTDAGVGGPFVVPVRTIAATSDSATASWTVQPRTEHGRLVSAAGVLRALRAVTAETAADDGPLAGAEVTGTVASTLRRIEVGVATARALVRIAVAVAAVLGLVAFGVLLVLLRGARTAEEALFVARGATRAQLLRWSVLETLLVSVVGAVTGTVAAVVTAAALGAGASVSPVGCAVTATTAVVLAVTAAALVGARPAWSWRRGGLWGGVVLTVAVTTAATFATWRSTAVGVPVRATGDRVVTDPIAAVAPVLGVLATALVTALAGHMVAALSARGVGRTRGFLPGLVIRRTARTWGSSAPVVVLVATAVAVGALAAGLSATTTSVDAATAGVVVGLTVRVSTDGDDAVSDLTPLPAQVDGPEPAATAVAPVLTDQVTAGGRTVPLVAVRAGSARAVLGVAGAAAFAGTATPAPAGSPLQGGGRRVVVDVQAGAATLAGVVQPEAVGSVRFDLWAVDGDGVPAEVPLSAADGADVPLGTTRTLRADLPERAAGPAAHWRLLAVEPALSFSARPPSVDAGTGPDRLQVPVRVSVPGSTAARGATTLEDLAGPSRIPLGRSATSGRLPVVTTDVLASALGLRPGSPLDLVTASTGRTLHARVVGTVPVVPGSGSAAAVAADLPTLVDATVLGGPAVSDPGGGVPRADETWLAGPTASTLAADVGRHRTGSGDVTTGAAVSSAPVVDPAVRSLVVVAGFGTLLALLVFAGTVAASRDADQARTLRALGVGPRAAGRAQAAELGVPVLVGTLGGVVGGAVTVALVVVPFAIAAVPGAAGLLTASPVVVTPWSGLVPLVVIAGTLVVTVLAASRTRSAVAHGGAR